MGKYDGPSFLRQKKEAAKQHTSKHKRNPVDQTSMYARFVTEQPSTENIDVDRRRSNRGILDSGTRHQDANSLRGQLTDYTPHFHVTEVPSPMHGHKNRQRYKKKTNG